MRKTLLGSPLFILKDVIPQTTNLNNTKSVHAHANVIKAVLLLLVLTVTNAIIFTVASLQWPLEMYFCVCISSPWLVSVL